MYSGGLLQILHLAKVDVPFHSIASVKMCPKGILKDVRSLTQKQTSEVLKPISIL